MSGDVDGRGSPASPEGEGTGAGASSGLAGRDDLHLVLVHPEIPWNTGNIGRTCLAAGAQLHLVKPLGFSLDAREVRRAGLDYWPRVKPLVWESWERFASELPDLGEAYYFSSKASRTLWEVSFPRPAVLVFGREAEGLPAKLRRRHADRLLRIPMRDSALRSLNLATAAGVVLYEVLRQWRQGASAGS